MVVKGGRCRKKKGRVVEEKSVKCRGFFVKVETVMVKDLEGGVGSKLG